MSLEWFAPIIPVKIEKRVKSTSGCSSPLPNLTQAGWLVRIFRKLI